MLSFIIKRPIAVTMLFVAAIVLGIISIFNIPVSLIPEVDIPIVTVYVEQKEKSARELQDLIVTPIRNSIKQIPNLESIYCETRDGVAILKCELSPGSNVDYSFLEINEKIDQTMVLLPKEVNRPKVVKAVASDIPVLYINAVLRDAKNIEVNKIDIVDSKFVELGSFVRSVIKKRLEQLPEVALVDISGIVDYEFRIIPDLEKVKLFGASLQNIETAIVSQNVDFGSVTVEKAYHQYNIKLNDNIKDQNDIENIYVRTGGRIFQIKDIATVARIPNRGNGVALSDGKEAIIMAVIKQSGSRMDDLQNKLNAIIEQFHSEYPEIEFKISRDQTKLLSLSLSNLYQDLFWGGIIALIVLSIFLKEASSSMLIGLTLPSSIVIIVAVFYLLGISINIISLGGLVLGVGMMIDNSIIVIDNISQHVEKTTLINACTKGASEVFVSMLCSVLTTCSVFIPLIFLSGISGELFYDEAITVTIGAFISLLLSMTIIPVYYRLLPRRKNTKDDPRKSNKAHGLYNNWYNRGFKFLFRKQIILISVIVVIAIGGVWSYYKLPKEKLPLLSHDDVVAKIQWKEQLNLKDNLNRIISISNKVDGVIHQTALIGEQQFILESRRSKGNSEVILYYKAKNSEDLAKVKMQLLEAVSIYPGSAIKFEEAENIFNFIFGESQSDLVARLSSTNQSINNKEMLSKIFDKIATTEQIANVIAWKDIIVIKVDFERLMILGISLESLQKDLIRLFQSSPLLLVNDTDSYTPVYFSIGKGTLDHAIENSFVESENGNLYPIKDLIKIERSIARTTIYSDIDGEFFPVEIIQSRAMEKSMESIKSAVFQDGYFDVSFGGSYFSRTKLFKELFLVLIVSIVLLYLILAVQFGSLVLPIIILIEIPIGIAGALIFLNAFGAGINLMSLIGIVVMTGIIINDSNLKVDTYVQLRKKGASVLRVVYEGGKKRFNSILMTSLITVFAFIPLLFTPGLGSELQLPLAISLAGGMTLGTFASLFFMPVCYYHFYKK